MSARRLTGFCRSSVKKRSRRSRGERDRIVAQIQERRSRQAKRFERARRMALKEAERIQREEAVRSAMSERFIFPELQHFAHETGVSGDCVPDDGEKRSWLDIFCLIADQIDHSIMLVDMNVPKLPLAFCNHAAEVLTGYEKHEMMGRNCKFLQGKKTQGAAVRAFAKAVREATESTVVCTNFRKDGSQFKNLVALQPIFHDDESKVGYQYSVAIQCEYTDGVEQQEWFLKLRDALPKRVSTEQEAAEHAAAVVADGHSVGSLARQKLAAAHQKETVIMCTRLVYSLDWRVTLRHLLRGEWGTNALKSWLLQTEEENDGTTSLVKKLELASGFGFKLASCGTRDEAAELILGELGPKFLGAEMPGTVENAFAMLRTRAEAACMELADNALPRFVQSKVCLRVLEERGQPNVEEAQQIHS